MQLCENNWHIVDMLTFFPLFFSSFLLVYLNFGILLIFFFLNESIKSVKQSVSFFFSTYMYKQLCMCVSVFICICFLAFLKKSIISLEYQYMWPLTGFIEHPLDVGPTVITVL